jgi:uncharacterized protein YkwD
MYFFGINLVDVAIILVVLFFIRDGYRNGFFALTIEMFSFLLGLVVALLVYGPLGGYLSEILGMSRPFAKVLVFLLVWLLVEAMTPIFTSYLYTRIPATWLASRWNRFLGFIPALVESVLLCSFLLSLAIAFPFPSLLKQVIFSSRLGEPLVRVSQLSETIAGEIIGQSSRETLSFLTVGQTSKESVKLGFVTNSMFPDPEIERQMFEMLNAERSKIGLAPLIFDSALTEIARLHAADMFRRGYFAHFSPEGRDVSARADAAGVVYSRIGENLAYTPDVTVAHAGLMRSPKHRENILTPQFTRVGIGVQNAGTNGLMFVQNFAF